MKIINLGVKYFINKKIIIMLKVITKFIKKQQKNALKRKLKKFESETYQKFLIMDFYNYGSFAKKNVVEIGSDLLLQTANIIKGLGAKKVLCFNPCFTDKVVSNNKDIVVYKKDGRYTELPDESVDVVFAIALVEHLEDPIKLAQEIKRILKPNGIAYIQGNPIWTCYRGHHVYAELPEKSYYFHTETNPFNDWEHLFYENDKEMEKGLLEKGLPEEHARFIANQIMNSDMISRLTASKIEEEFLKVDGLDIKVKRSFTQDKEPPAKLLNKYTKEDLLTEELAFIIKKQ